MRASMHMCTFVLKQLMSMGCFRIYRTSRYLILLDVRWIDLSLLAFFNSMKSMTPAGAWTQELLRNHTIQVSRTSSVTVISNPVHLTQFALSCSGEWSCATASICAREGYQNSVGGMKYYTSPYTLPRLQKNLACPLRKPVFRKKIFWGESFIS